MILAITEEGGGGFVLGGEQKINEEESHMRFEFSQNLNTNPNRYMCPKIFTNTETRLIKH